MPQWAAADAERALLAAGFGLLRSKGSYRIYGNRSLRGYRSVPQWLKSTPEDR